MRTLVFLLVLSLSSKAQEVSCDSLMNYPLFNFNTSALPEGFLDCLDLNELDMPSLKMQYNKLKGKPGSWLVADLKTAVDSVNRLGYRSNQEKMRQCLNLFSKNFNSNTWLQDSLALLQCGAAASELEMMGSIWRSNPKTWEGKKITELASDYEKRLPAIIETEINRNSSFCEIDGGRSAAIIGPGLKAHDNLDDALNCSRKQGKPLLIYFTALENADSRRMENKEWMELDLLRLLNEEYVLLLLHRDDLSELPDEEKRPSSLEKDFMIENRAHLAIEIVYSKIESTEIPALIAVGRTGKVLDYRLGFQQTNPLLEFLSDGLKKFASE